MTAQQVIDAIKFNSGGKENWNGETVDTFKAGDPQTIVTGILTTFTPTMEVLAKAVENNCNLIISHEPTFYNHTDDTKWLENDPVYKTKLQYINDHHLIIFRFHDHWHNIPGQPDGITLGMADTLRWQKYQSKDDQTIFDLPETTLKDLAHYIKTQLKIRTMRVIGNPNLKVSRIAFLPGAWGGAAHVKAFEKKGVQVLLVGESNEWEGIAYAVDAVGQHRDQAMILMGHVPSEETGMKYCTKWMKNFLPGIPIKFVPAGEPFWLPN
jgi:putative NIF3 family GTP cyclohydrolase 1 type 2